MRASNSRSSDVRRRLRAATFQAHASLHEHPAFVAVIEGRADLPLYRCLLSRLYGIHQPLEVALACADRHLPPGLRSHGRSRVALIEQDLIALGIDATDVARLPRKAGLQPLRSRGAALGALYVVQGSTLGGEVIARSLRQRFADQPVCSFFTGFADDRQAWRRCCDALEQCADDIGRLTAAAVSTFEHIGAWMSGWPGAERS